VGAPGRIELFDLLVEQFFALSRFEGRNRIAGLPIDWSNLK